MAKVASAEITIVTNARTVVSDATNISGSVNIPAGVTSSATLANGAGAENEIDIVARVKDTIASGTPSVPVTHDLEAIEDPAGDTVDFDNVRVEFHYFKTSLPGDVLKIGDTSNPFTQRWLGGTSPVVNLPHNGSVIITKPSDTAGWVVNASNKNVGLDAGSISSTVEVLSFYAGNG